MSIAYIFMCVLCKLVDVSCWYSKSGDGDRVYVCVCVCMVVMVVAVKLDGLKDPRPQSMFLFKRVFLSLCAYAAIQITFLPCIRVYNIIIHRTSARGRVRSKSRSRPTKEMLVVLAFSIRGRLKSSL